VGTRLFLGSDIRCLGTQVAPNLRIIEVNGGGQVERFDLLPANLGTAQTGSSSSRFGQEKCVETVQEVLGEQDKRGSSYLKRSGN